MSKSNVNGFNRLAEGILWLAFRSSIAIIYRKQSSSSRQTRSCGPERFVNGCRRRESEVTHEDHSAHHVHGGSRGRGHESVVRVEHDLGARALLPLTEAVVGLVDALPVGNVVTAVETGRGEAARWSAILNCMA